MQDRYHAGRPVTRKLAFVMVVLAACQTGDSPGNLGAVSFRWRIVDKTTGQIFDPNDQARSDGSCSRFTDQSVAMNCAPDTPGWWVQRVRLNVSDPVTSAMPPILSIDGGRQVEFACRAREATTDFIVPPGRWALEIEVRNDPQECMVPPPTTPAASVREVKKGEIVNLDVIEIAVRPPPPGPQVDLGAPEVSDAGLM